jgi:hypothetical protein
VTFIGTSPHPILQTIRIPLAAFGKAAFLKQLRGVRFTFDDTKADEIFIGNIRLSTVSSVTTTQSFGLGALGGDDSVIADTAAAGDVNQVKSLREVALASGATASSSSWRAIANSCRRESCSCCTSASVNSPPAVIRRAARPAP